MAAAGERTKRIKLGTGVLSLPYHHPLMVADRMVLVDHMTEGRAMLGVGPGALVSDAYMMGIPTVEQRRMMGESLDAIMRLLRGDEPVTMKTDWFELNDARLQLNSFHRPVPLPVAAATASAPSGPTLAAARRQPAFGRRRRQQGLRADLAGRGSGPGSGPDDLRELEGGRADPRRGIRASRRWPRSRKATRCAPTRATRAIRQSRPGASRRCSARSGEQAGARC